MIPRYQSSAMKSLWSDETKFARWFRVEEAFLKAWLAYQKQEDPELQKRLRRFCRGTRLESIFHKSKPS